MIDKQELIRIYSLANLRLEEEQVPVLTEKYSKVLEFANLMWEVDTSQVEDTEITVSHAAPLREDIPAASIPREDALKNAKDKEYGYFRLQRIFD